MPKINKALEFSELLNKFRSVERAVLVNGEDRMENDVEHSYFLAMLAWYIADANKLDLDKNLLLKYALIHDFVEVHAGDTYIYSEDEAYKKSKIERESKAMKKLKEDVREFNELHELIEEYEKKKDRESRFIYALDKIQPVINIYLDGGKTWKLKNITLKMLVDHKKEKVRISSEVETYFDELIALLGGREKELFNKAESE